MESPEISVVVLAAGASSRSLEPKQLLLYRGKPLLRHAVEVALGSRCRPVIVVLGSRALSISDILTDLTVRMVINDNWRSGISSSIRTGLRTAEDENDLDGILFMTADQPLVTSEILDYLCEIFREKRPPVVACEYKGTVGIPALFDCSLFGAFKDLQGDEGAKNIILQQRKRAIIVDCPEAGIDVDTEEDLIRLIES